MSLPTYLGESAGNSGMKLLLEDDVRRASVAEQPKPGSGQEKYDRVFMGVRWGRTTLSKSASGTSCAVLGKRKGDMGFDVLDYRIFQDSSRPRAQVQEIGDLFGSLRCDHLLYQGGADPGMEYMIAADAGIPENNRSEILYSQGLEKKMAWKAGIGRYELDRSGSLMLLAKAIIDGTLRLPPPPQFRRAASHLLSLRGRRPQEGIQKIQIDRVPHQRVDLAHAINYALSGLLYAYDGFEALHDAGEPLEDILWPR